MTKIQELEAKKINNVLKLISNGTFKAVIVDKETNEEISEVKKCMIYYCRKIKSVTTDKDLNSFANGIKFKASFDSKNYLNSKLRILYTGNNAKKSTIFADVDLENVDIKTAPRKESSIDICATLKLFAKEFAL